MFIYAIVIFILILFTVMATIAKGENPLFAFAIMVFFVLYLMGIGQ